jgi:hypothetical protein
MPDSSEDRLSRLLDLFDRSQQPVRVREIRTALEKLKDELTEATSESLKHRLLFELYAFTLVEADPDNGRDFVAWKPRFHCEDQEGNPIDIPNLAPIDSTFIEYWEERASKVTHPYIKRRYAGLVLGLRKGAGAPNPPLEVIHTFIDEALQLAPHNTAEAEHVLVQYQVRALNTALGIRDDQRVATVKRTIIDFERAHGQDELPGTWGQSFDQLIGRPSGALATEDETQEIVDAIESRLDRLAANLVDPKLLAVEYAAKRLGDHYHRTGLEDLLDKVIEHLRVALVSGTNEGDPRNAALWSGRFGELCERWERAEAQGLFEKRFRHFTELARHTLRRLITPMGIDEKTIADIIEDTLGANLQESLHTIAVRYLVNQERLESTLDDQAAQTPLSHMMPRISLAHNGRPESTIGGVEHDRAGRLVTLAGEEIAFNVVFLDAVLAAAVDRHSISLDDLFGHFLASPLFQRIEPDGLLQRCLCSWLSGDHLGFAHFSVTLIERALRVLVSANGAPWKPSRHGGMHVRLLDDVLRDEAVIGVLGDDACFHLRVVLTDTRGHNLRNNIAHGLVSFRNFGRQQSLTLFHALLILALVIEKQENGEE